MILPRLAALFLLTAATATAGSSTWYVDVAASGPGSGTQGDPFTSLQQALSNPSVVDGDTVLVAPGTYVENVDFTDKSVSLEAQLGPGTVRIKPAVPTQGTLQNFGTYSQMTGFVLSDSELWAVAVGHNEGLTITRCIFEDNEVGLLNLWDGYINNSNFVGNGIAIEHHNIGHGSAAITYVWDSIFFENTTDLDGYGLGTLFVETSLQGDPLFFAPEDHHVQFGSPCVNAGDPDETDPDGSRLDIGVFPYDPNYPLGESYCTPTANTSGGRAVIAISGSASLAANDLSLAATRTPPNASGLFFYGTEQAYFPLGEGFVCLGGSVGRLPIAPTGPTGTPQFLLDNTALPGHVPPILPGEGRGFQYWFRDPTGGSFGWNYSNAVWVVFAP